jgi:putative sigma-54 modulation protein
VKGAVIMKIRIVGKNIEVTEALRSIIEKKVSKLEKYFAENVNATATLSVQRNLQKIEVLIPFNNVVLRAEEKDNDMYAAIDLVIDKLEGQIRKQKTKLQKRNYENSLRIPVSSSYEEDLTSEEPQIVKTKRFAMKPMSDEEAVLQMELLDHDFFVYKNSHTNQVNVLYKRKDGNYGLIEQQF